MATTKTAEQLAKEICLREENTGKHLLDVMAIGMHEYDSLQTSELIEAVEKVKTHCEWHYKNTEEISASTGFKDCIELLDELLKTHKP